jgi:hypothetical protein
VSLRVGPGLAVDGRGRELRLQKDWCDDDVVAGLPDDLDCDDDGWVHACVVVEFDGCLSAPVPTLADPCDVDRGHDDFSRVVETARVRLRPGHCPGPEPGAYPRVRALLGTHHLREDTPAGRQVRDARAALLTVGAEELAAALWRHVRALAAHDVAELRPGSAARTARPEPFPLAEDRTAVVLAGVRFRVEKAGCRRTVRDLEVDISVRPALLPTSMITELLCGLSPGPLWQATGPDQEGPRVDQDSLDWRDEQTLTFRVTAPIHPGSLRDAVHVSSLGEQGWGEKSLAVGHPRTEDGDRLVVVMLAEPLDRERFRLVVRGTGTAPAFGRDPAVPLAGVLGGPPGSADDGHDAVVSRPHPATPGTAGS